MASTYNNRPLIPEVMVRGDSHAVVRVRQEAETLFALERTPGWQETGSNADPNIRNTA